MTDVGDLRPASGINWNNADRTVGVVEYGNGKDTHAVFYMRPVLNGIKTRELSRPYYDDVPHVRIAQPGERLNVVDRPATAHDQMRFALQWAQFQQNSQQRPAGTPISTLYPEQPSIVAMLEASQVWTVEQLADLSANAIENIGMGCQSYVNAAQQYLKIAEKGVKAHQFRQQLEERDNKIHALEQNVQELNNTVTKLLNERRQQGIHQGERAYAGGMERPTHMPNTPFDAQAEQIAATGRATRGTPKQQQNEQRQTAKRSRPRLAE